VLPIKRDLCLIHQTKTLGGSHLNPDITWVAILGMEESAVLIKLNGQESLQHVTFISPPWDTLVTMCVSITTFTSLGPITNDEEDKLRSMICIPPLLAETEMNSDSKKPADLATTFIAEMDPTTDSWKQATSGTNQRTT
jgi:hypothetical protein